MENEDSDDDISLVSRTPSPPPSDKMDVDKYDEYVRGHAAPEAITVNTKIKSTNKGFAMLAKLGWTEGQPLGLSSEGRVDPVPFHVKRDLTGLGKTSQDVRMIETTVSQRRGLDSERQQKETEEQRRLREDSVARRAAVQTEISETLRAFYCTVCDKQFQNVAQYDEHTNSYAHHHKVRFRDMQLAQRQKQNTQEEIDKRKDQPAPAFRTGGWSSLDTTSQPLPPVPATAPLPPPIPNQPVAQGWAPQRLAGANNFSTGTSVGRDFGPPIPPSVQPPPVRPLQVSDVPHPSSGITNLAAPSSQGSTPTPKKDDKREKGRSGWQAFQRGGRRK
ncbi:hypothetical protein DENSPDRAFT_477093 [Dentipellis sp. KUC8613]|nr:hypothetical protein DENSPDRAFT_477093 [Dentipellis sp. KUC8613]